MPALDTLRSSLLGHYWTVQPVVATLGWRGAARAGLVDPSQRWSGEVADERGGRVRLAGQLHAPPGARRLLVLVHGLGGSAMSRYLAAAASLASAEGLACLRLSLRGAEGDGEDFYHAALTADLHAALASPMLADFEEVYVLGYSLGGHLSLCFASEAHDARVRAVAAVCAPVDLARSVSAIDRVISLPYRHYVLGHLKRAYAAVARRHALPTSLARVLRVTRLREWDALTVVPRHGFASTEDYYARASVSGRWQGLCAPALLVNTEHDPMVPAWTVRPALGSAPAGLDVRWLSGGGHVGFPGREDLGEPGPLGLEPQVLSWLQRAGLGG